VCSSPSSTFPRYTFMSIRIDEGKRWDSHNSILFLKKGNIVERQKRLFPRSLTHNQAELTFYFRVFFGVHTDQPNQPTLHVIQQPYYLHTHPTHANSPFHTWMFHFNNSITFSIFTILFRHRRPFYIETLGFALSLSVEIYLFSIHSLYILSCT